MFLRTRKSNGAGIVEAVVGLFVVIPLVLALVDVGSMVVCQTSNDAMAKQAARAAAAANIVANPGSDQTAAQNIISNWPGKSAIAGAPTLVTFKGSAAAGQVYVRTQMTCVLPIPIPMAMTSINFQAEDTEPYTAILPN